MNIQNALPFSPGDPVWVPFSSLTNTPPVESESAAPCVIVSATERPTSSNMVTVQRVGRSRVFEVDGTLLDYRNTGQRRYSVLTAHTLTDRKVCASLIQQFQNAGREAARKIVKTELESMAPTTLALSRLVARGVLTAADSMLVSSHVSDLCTNMQIGPACAELFEMILCEHVYDLWKSRSTNTACGAERRGQYCSAHKAIQAASNQWCLQQGFERACAALVLLRASRGETPWEVHC